MEEIRSDWSVRHFRSREDLSTSQSHIFGRWLEVWNLRFLQRHRWGIKTSCKRCLSAPQLRGLRHGAFRTVKSTLTTTLLIFGEQKKDVFLPHVIHWANWVPLFAPVPSGNLLKGLKEWWGDVQGKEAEGECEDVRFGGGSGEGEEIPGR